MIASVTRAVFKRPILAKSRSYEETDPVIELLSRTDAFLRSLEGDVQAALQQARDNRSPVFDWAR